MAKLSPKQASELLFGGSILASKYLFFWAYGAIGGFVEGGPLRCQNVLGPAHGLKAVRILDLGESTRAPGKKARARRELVTETVLMRG